MSSTAVNPEDEFISDIIKGTLFELSIDPHRAEEILKGFYEWAYDKGAKEGREMLAERLWEGGHDYDIWL